MKKDFARKKTRFHHLILGGVIFIIGMSMVFLAVKYKQKIITSAAFPSYFMRASALISQHRDHLQWELVRVKQLAANKDNKETAIHFEFYNTLPNRQVTTMNSQQKITLSANKMIVNAEELKQDLASRVEQKRYIIQFGVFHSAQAAEQYRQVLVDVGFGAAIVKIKLGHQEIYRVQQGPFSDIRQAKLLQKKLQKRGINSILRTK